MELLKFSMPPFARIVWTSQDVQQEWEPKLLLAKKAYNQLEMETVIHGLRSCTTAHINPDRLIPAMQEYAARGLVYQPMLQVGAYSGFAHSHPPVIDGRPWSWYGVLARNAEDAYAFANASSVTEESKDKEIDHLAIGSLLGYPTCCQNFFNTVWKAGYVDPIWQQAENCKEEYVANKEDHLIQLKKETPWETSSMLRYIGVRVLPHIPCSHDCQESHRMAIDWINLGLKLKIEGINELEEFLRLPIEWDCLKGTAYISTPLFKVETNSMTCYPKHVVQKEGTYRPKGGAKGLKFPFIPMGSDKYAHLFGGGKGC